MNSRSLLILNDKVSGTLRIVPGEMDALRGKVNCCESPDRFGGR